MSEERKLLLVDDDALVLGIYQRGLERHGFQVATAGDGLAAVRALRGCRPDAVVLDLMMPKFTGVDVLRFIRSDKDLAELPVVVLSNSYLDELAQQAAKAGVQHLLLKSRCTPLVLIGAINEALTQPPDSGSADAAPSAAGAVAPGIAAAAASNQQSEDRKADEELHLKARRDFLAHAAGTCAVIRNLCHEFINAKDEAERERHLQDFYRKIHFISATAGLAQCHPISMLASVFEALLFGLIDKPDAITPSVLRTVASTVDFFETLFDHCRELSEDDPPSAQVLVVDDDPMANRIAVAALQQAQLQAISMEDPRKALAWLQKNRFDLVLLDIEMEGMDGFELCKQMRALPGYRNTPVIYVTGHSDFSYRAKSVLSGGNDLIAKPILPIELAVKAVTHLMKSRFAA